MLCFMLMCLQSLVHMVVSCPEWGPGVSLAAAAPLPVQILALIAAGALLSGPTACVAVHGGPESSDLPCGLCTRLWDEAHVPVHLETIMAGKDEPEFLPLRLQLLDC